MLSKIIGPIRKILEKDYAAVIRRKLDDVYRAGIAGTAQRSERSQQDAYIVCFIPNHALVKSFTFYP